MPISVVIPARSNSSHLKECLRSLKDQTLKAKEIIVVLDISNAETVKIIKKYGARSVLDKNNTIGGAYDIGARSARGDIVAFIDDDCVAPCDWIEKLEKEFEENVNIVGGEDLLPKNSTFFQEAVYQIDKARMVKKPIYGEHARNRLRAANVAYRKNIFSKDSFNPKLKGLQEPEFHYRLSKKNCKMKFNPNVFVYHKRRNSLHSIFYQIYRNGKAKIDLVKLHKGMLSFIDLMPFVFIIYSILMIYFSVATPKLFFFVWILSIIAYFLIKPLIIVMKTHGAKYYFHLIPIIFIREIAYALGIITGFPKIFRK